MASKIRLRNAAQLVTVCSNKERIKVDIIENGTIIINEEGIIEAIGKESQLAPKYKDVQFKIDLDCTGKCIVPGLVDPHTHPVWSGDRTHEFAMKLEGATYMDIHKMGGGIGFSVRKTRESSEEELRNLLLKRLNIMLKNGTTLVETKSGYGLNTETEIKMLKVLHSVRDVHPIEIVSTYLGAHSVPKDEMNLQQYTENIIKEQLPEVMKQKKLGTINPEFIDVFHEKGVFETEETRAILKAGKDAGLEINFHGDELHPMKSAELGAELGAVAISHLECVSDEGISAMAQKEICAILLPTTSYILKIPHAPARKLIDNNVPVALATDFNPNAHCMSMPFVMNLACVQLKMTMNEALVASTINAAAALNKSKTHGSLEVGKVGDCLIIDAPIWEHLIYEMVDPPISHVIKKGKIVYESKI